MFYYKYLEFEYTLMKASFCDITDYKKEVKYSTLSEAKSACSRNIDCNLVYDYNCDGGWFWTCSGNRVKSRRTKSCTWSTGIIKEYFSLERLPVSYTHLTLPTNREL